MRSERLPESLLPLPEVLAARPCASEYHVSRLDRPGYTERTEYRWDGAALVAWRNDEGETRLSYDDCGRLTRVGELATFRYDARGFPVSDEAGFAFDLQGRLVKERTAGGYALWTYAPRKVTRLASAGSRDEALFDEEGRLQEERVVDDRGAVVLKLLWSYPPRRRVMEERGGDGRLHATTTWTQDAQGRPVDVVTRDASGEPTQTTTYLYDCR